MNIFLSLNRVTAVSTGICDLFMIFNEVILHLLHRDYFSPLYFTLKSDFEW